MSRWHWKRAVATAQQQPGRPRDPRLRAQGYFALLNIAVIVTGFLLVLHVQSSQRHDQAAQQAAQRRQGELIERRLCTTLDRLASRDAPPGPPQDKSRQYLEWLHQQLAGLGPDVGCPQRKR